MKWFIDDNGWPQTKSISADEWQGLIHRSEKIEDSVPKLFDMRNRSDGIVIREPMDMDDYLEHNSPDSPLLKSTEAVLKELQSQDLDSETLMDEQRAIEADLETQQLVDPALRLFQTSKKSLMNSRLVSLWETPPLL
ncbi:hypothetical protein LINGRAHAP2_LOCUS24781 [Linum grandiflorum]